MRIFNLTDVKTTVLEQRGLVDQHIAVKGRMVSPGEYVDVEDTPTVRSSVEDLVRHGALSIDQLPPPYLVARQQAAAVDPGRIGSKVSQHVDMKETKTAGEPVPGPPVEGETVVVTRHDPAAEPSDTLAPPQDEDPPPLQPPSQPPKKKHGNR